MLVIKKDKEIMLSPLKKLIMMMLTGEIMVLLMVLKTKVVVVHVGLSLLLELLNQFLLLEDKDYKDYLNNN